MNTSALFGSSAKYQVNPPFGRKQNLSGQRADSLNFVKPSIALPQTDTLQFSGGKRVTAWVMGSTVALAGLYVGAREVAPIVQEKLQQHDVATSKAAPNAASTPKPELVVTDNEGNLQAKLRSNGDVVDLAGKKLGSVSTNPVEDLQHPEWGKVFIAYGPTGEIVAWGHLDGRITSRYPDEERTDKVKDKTKVGTQVCDDGEKGLFGIPLKYPCGTKDVVHKVAAQDSVNGYLVNSGEHVDVRLIDKGHSKEQLPSVAENTTVDVGNVTPAGKDYELGLKAAVASVVAKAHGQLVYSLLPPKSKSSD